MVSKTQILIVDDHPTNIKVLSDLLIDYGFEVLVAKDGENALQKLQRVSPDLILLDVLMPGIDGFETCQRLKAQENTRDIPVIFMTALADAVDKIKGLTLGAVDYITKPLQHEEVIARVNVHLQLRRLTHHLSRQNALLQNEMRSRQLAQTAQQRSEEKFAKIFCASPTAMAIFNWASGHLIEINQSFSALLGHAPEEILGKTLDELGFWEHATDRNHCYQQLSATQQWEQIELPYITPAGATQYFLTSAVIIELAQATCVLLTAQDVTRSKQAEIALHDQETRLRAIFEQLAVGLCYSDRQGNLLQANQKYCDILHYKMSDIAQLTVEQITYPPDFAIDQAQTQRLLAGEIASFSLEKRYLRKDGVPVWVKLTLSPIRDPAGTIVILGGVLEDINEWKQLETARQQAEIKLRQSEAKLRTAQHVARLGDWELDVASQTLTWSAELFDIFGFDPTQPAPTFAEFLELVDAADRSVIMGLIEQALQQGQPYQVDCQIMRPDGVTGYVESRGQALQNDQGQVVKLFGTIMVITERKQVEAALRHSEARLQLVLDANNDAIWDWDILTDQTFRSPQWYQTLGYTAAEITAGEAEWRDRIHPDDRDRVQALQVAYLAGQVPHYITEYRLRRKDGSYCWVESRGIAQWDQQGQPRRMIGSSRDVTAAKQQATELQQAREAAEAANRAKSLFLANINHELRTPLTIILGCSELLNFDPVLTPKHKQRLASIDRSVQHLLALINNVLELSKVEAGATDLEMATVDLWQLLRNLAEMFLPQAAAKGLQFVIERSADLPQLIQTDERKLTQILINFLGNAMKFTTMGQVRLAARVETTTASCSAPRSPAPRPTSAPTAPVMTLCFTVEDTGDGIAPAELAGIFEAFVQTELGRRSHQGTGLGLSICRHFARLMQGDITVQSAIGQGTQFSLVLPVQPVRVWSAVQPVQPTMRQLLGQGNYRVLVVEDTADMREILMQILAAIGFELREAVNGQEAIAVWQTWHPHLILMDMRMPVLDGYAATRQIREQEQARQHQWRMTGAADSFAPTPTIIIAVTANAFAEDRPAILAAGCDDIVCKPFKEADLITVIADRLGVKPLVAHPQAASAATGWLRPQMGTNVPQLLGAMPNAWLTALHQAALRLNADLCLTLIEQIPPQQVELVEALTSLLETFRFDVMVDLIVVSQTLCCDVHPS